MTLFQKIVSVTFASIVLFISVVSMLTLSGILAPDLGSNMMEDILEGEFWSKVFFAVFAILAIFAIKEIAFGEKVSREGREGLILENESGKLIISKESLESLVAGVGKEIDGVDSISSRTFIDDEKNVVVEANIGVGREVALKDISAELQRKVKEALKQTADLEVKYVNIKIKNISNKKSKKNNNNTNTTEKNPVEVEKKGVENNE
ncbi:MAG: alkaline shock response membrane anchor protein AmaP [Clostridia bacterium]|nr:alkaline shock response membrane anchor protein AmaP [Clostridia bacterium]